jgi:hypothetical protein
MGCHKEAIRGVTSRGEDPEAQAPSECGRSGSNHRGDQKALGGSSRCAGKSREVMLAVAPTITAPDPPNEDTFLASA